MTTTCTQSCVFTQFHSLTLFHGLFLTLEQAGYQLRRPESQKQAPAAQMLLQEVTRDVPLQLGSYIPYLLPIYLFCDPRTHSPICREMRNSISAIMVAVTWWVSAALKPITGWASFA